MVCAVAALLRKAIARAVAEAALMVRIMWSSSVTLMKLAQSKPRRPHDRANVDLSRRSPTPGEATNDIHRALTQETEDQRNTIQIGRRRRRRCPIARQATIEIAGEFRDQTCCEIAD